jgi:hypothetical protein
MATITVKFNAAPPPANQVFQVLRVQLTDAGGTVNKKDLFKADIEAAAVAQPDGSYQLPVAFTAAAVGPYTVTAQAFNSLGTAMGPAVSGSGTIALSDGVWYPAPSAFV